MQVDKSSCALLYYAGFISKFCHTFYMTLLHTVMTAKGKNIALSVIYFVYIFARLKGEGSESGFVIPLVLGSLTVFSSEVLKSVRGSCHP